MSYRIHIKLLSDATFGRGDGVAGLVDSEVEYDPATGLPFLRGRTLKGLLVEECANTLFSIPAVNPSDNESWIREARLMFGMGGSTLDDDGCLQFGHAQLPDDLRQAVALDVRLNRISPAEVLESLTAIRRQTAVDDETGAPEDESLRSMRVLLRETELWADVTCSKILSKQAEALLAVCVASLRRAGTGRNRGRGRILARLIDGKGNDITHESIRFFQTLMEETAA